MSPSRHTSVNGVLNGALRGRLKGTLYELARAPSDLQPRMVSSSYRRRFFSAPLGPIFWPLEAELPEEHSGDERYE